MGERGVELAGGRPGVHHLAAFLDDRAKVQQRTVARIMAGLLDELTPRGPEERLVWIGLALGDGPVARVTKREERATRMREQDLQAATDPPMSRMPALTRMDRMVGNLRPGRAARLKSDIAPAAVFARGERLQALSLETASGGHEGRVRPIRSLMLNVSTRTGGPGSLGLPMFTHSEQGPKPASEGGPVARTPRGGVGSSDPAGGRGRLDHDDVEPEWQPRQRRPVGQGLPVQQPVGGGTPRVRLRWSTVSSGSPKSRRPRQRTSTMTSADGGPGSTATRSIS